MSLTPEEIESNWIRFNALLGKLGDRSEAAMKMMDVIGERLAVCPASSKKDFHCAFPGGLVDHSLRVLGNAMKMQKAFDWNIPRESLIIGALFHDLGKVGSETEDLYVPSSDDWRRDKLGEMYTINNAMQYMDIPSRGIFLCQHFGLKLTVDETLAIKLNDGFVLQENKQYCLKSPPLAVVIMTADYISTCQEKGTLP